MTPTEALIFKLKHENEIKAITGAVITTIAITTVVMLLLSPILIPLWIVEKTVKAIKATWAWFFPEPQGK